MGILVKKDILEPTFEGKLSLAINFVALFLYAIIDGASRYSNRTPYIFEALCYGVVIMVVFACLMLMVNVVANTSVYYSYENDEAPEMIAALISSIPLGVVIGCQIIAYFDILAPRQSGGILLLIASLVILLFSVILLGILLHFLRLVYGKLPLVFFFIFSYIILSFPILSTFNYTSAIFLGLEKIGNKEIAHSILWDYYIKIPRTSIVADLFSIFVVSSPFIVIFSKRIYSKIYNNEDSKSKPLVSGTREEDKHLKTLAQSDKVVVFTFGNTYAGKSSFLLAMHLYIMRNYRSFTNPASNGAGYYHINKITRDWLQYKTLPDVTSIYQNNDENIDLPIEIDIEVIHENKSYTFTFVDIAGEKFKPIYPENPNSKYQLDRQAEMYLAYKDVKIMLLNFIDSSTLEEVKIVRNPQADFTPQATLVNNFLLYLKKYYPERYKNLSIVFSKWDTINAHKESDIMQEITLENIYNLAETHILPAINEKLKAIDNAKTFAFSVGTPQENETRKLTNKRINLDFCPPIMEWLLHTHDILVPNKKEETRKIVNNG